MRLWTAALLWLAALAALMALFAKVGEHAWPVVILLYLPRLLWLVPAPVLLAVAVKRRRPAALVATLLGCALWLFGLSGFVLPAPLPAPSGPTLRVLSFNTTHGKDGPAGLRAVVEQAKPDLVLLQWASHTADEGLRGLEGWTVHRVAQFTIATRFPVVSVETGGLSSGSGPPCAHAVIDTPLGLLDVYDIRPQSAREEIGAEHNAGLRGRLATLIRDVRAGRLAQLAAFREAQVRSIAAMVAQAKHPVLLAGDTNLPSGSVLLRDSFTDLGDAFEQASWGFGYTHPARLPWLRLDRVLLGSGLRAFGFEVLPRHAASHRPVVAVIGRG